LDVFCIICWEHGLENLSEQNFQEMLVFANSAAFLITMRKGALHVMFFDDEIEANIAARWQCQDAL